MCGLGVFENAYPGRRHRSAGLAVVQGSVSVLLKDDNGSKGGYSIRRLDHQMKTYLFAASLAICCPLYAQEDAVLKESDSVTIENGSGKLTVAAGRDLVRNFTWNGQTRSVTMLKRTQPWMGSKSIYFPGPGEHWADNDGVTRGVIEEGRREFESLAAFEKWLKHEYQSYLDMKFVGKGRIGGWAIVKERKQLDCVIWEVKVGGKLLNESDFSAAATVRKKTP